MPYKGLAPAVNDLLAGQIDFMFDSATTVPHIKAGKLKALAVVGPNRLAALPDVKMLSAHGIKGVEVASGWHGLFAPAGTPPEIVAKLNAEALKVLAMPKVKERISALGAEPASSSSAELSKRLGERHRAARADREEDRRDARLMAASMTADVRFLSLLGRPVQQPQPLGDYVPARRVGNVVYVSTTPAKLGNALDLPGRRGPRPRRRRG